MNPTPKILITGATGFIGRALAAELRGSQNAYVVTASRSVVCAEEGTEHRVHDLLDPSAIPHLADIHTIIHTAARVHIMDDSSPDQLAAYRAANVHGTIALAQAAANAGVKRFIYLSSIKVNGEETSPDKPFTAFDVPNPQDPYGVSKWEAEQALREVERSSGLEVVVVRPPLVYGAGVKANFETMMKWLAWGVPLPFGAIDNRRSLVSLQNLLSLLSSCIHNANAGGKTFLVSDGEDLSTTQLLRRLAKALGQKSRLVPVSGRILTAVAALIGSRAVAQRICSSLQVDIKHTCDTLDWAPVWTVDEELRETAIAFRSAQQSHAY